jgi:hypothetical protein
MKIKIIVITIFLMISSLIGYSHAGVASGTVVGGSAMKPSASQVPAQAIQQVPFAPGNLILEVISSSQINLNWNDTSNNETGFAIERKTGNGQFSEIGRVGQNVVIYSNKGLSANSAYTYRIRAYNSAGYSPYTEEKSATTQPLKFISTTGLNKESSDQSALKTKLLDKGKQAMAFKMQEKSQKKLFELQNAENAKKNIRIQNLMQLIAAKRYTVTSACSGAAINSVSPSEVYPGDPILIQGCGFLTNEGMVVLNEYNIKLKINSWSDTSIEAVIPDDLAGFANPKNISIKVATVQGIVVGSQSILLKPGIEVAKYEPTVSFILDGITDKCFGDATTDSVVHCHGLEKENIWCEGTDTVSIDYKPLQNNWIFSSAEIHAWCNDYEPSCHECDSSVSVSQNISNCIGSKSCPHQNITVKWKINGNISWTIAYSPQIFIAGPRGTSPY